MTRGSMGTRPHAEADHGRAPGATRDRLLGAVGITAAVLLLTGLGGVDLWAPDEPRYAAVAEELRSFRHGVTGLALLHLNGEAYTQKPPLYFWLAALAGAPGGAVTEWAARLPSALCGIAAVVLLAQLGAGLLGRRSGAAAGLLLLTAFEFAHRARRVQLDVLLTLLELIAMAAFWRAADGAVRRRDVAALHAALGLAVLAKGPVGLLVPAFVIAAWLAVERRGRLLRELAPPWAVALSLGPGLVWAGAAFWLAPAGSFADAVGVNLLGRFFAGSSHARSLLYYLYQFPVNFLPWSLLWPLVAWTAARRVFVPAGEPGRRRAWRFLLLWVAVHFAFFSLSAGKRGLYLLPAFPAAALLCADAVVGRLAEHRPPGRWLGASLAGAAFALPLAALAAASVGALGGTSVPLRFGGALAVVSLLATGAWAGARRSSDAGYARTLVVCTAVAAAELAAFTLALPALDAEKSPRPIAQRAAALAAPGEPIGLAFKASLLGGLVYYADRPVALLADRPAVADFVRSGGRVLVLPAARLGEVSEVVDVSVQGRARRGARTVLVVTARSSGAGIPLAAGVALADRGRVGAGGRPASPRPERPPRQGVDAAQIDAPVGAGESRPDRKHRGEVGDR